VNIDHLMTYDVSERHARRLRQQCHAALQKAGGPGGPAEPVIGRFLGRVVGPALGGAWCLAYLAEIVRRLAAFYLLQP